MDIQFLKRLLRLLFSLLVAGIGVALAALGQEWYRLAHPSVSIPFVAIQSKC